MTRYVPFYSQLQTIQYFQNAQELVTGDIDMNTFIGGLTISASLVLFLRDVVEEEHQWLEQLISVLLQSRSPLHLLRYRMEVCWRW